MKWREMQWSREEKREMKWIGVERSGEEYYGVQWKDTKRSRVELREMKWNGVEGNAMECCLVEGNEKEWSKGK